MKKIAVIGGGYWGKNLIRNFYQLNRLNLVCDVSENVLAQYPNLETTINVEEAIKAVDSVVIATPAITHYKLVKAALELRKDVFVEKPLALTVKEGKKLVDLAEEKNVILMVGHLLEYHPAVIKIKDLIDQGILGKIYYIYSNRLNLGKIRQEENILWSFAPHDISVILRLLEDMPIEVYCSGNSYLTQGIPDVTVSNLTFPNGIRAHIFVNWLNPFKEQKLVVMGSEQMIVFDDTITQKLTLYPHQINWTKKSLPVANKKDGQGVEIDESEPLKIEVQHFLESIDQSKKPLTDGRSALNVLRVLEACHVSLEGAKRVSLTIEDYFITPTTIIEQESKIGRGTKIWHFSHIMKSAKIGEDCTIGKYVSIEPDVVIGDRVKIQNNVSIFSGVIIKDDVFIGPGVKFTNVKRPRAEFPTREYKNTLVDHGVTIGAGSVIVCGIFIGEYAFIGAGSVVTKNVPPYALIVGNPAKVIGRVNKKGERIE